MQMYIITLYILYVIYDLLIIYAVVNEKLVLDANYNSYFQITNGNVGIGTTSPNMKLSVDGDISASGVIIADTFQSTGGDVDGISFTDDLNLSGNLTASGDISGSGNIFGTGNLDIDGTSNLQGNVTLQNDLSVSGNITGSNDIS